MLPNILSLGLLAAGAGVASALPTAAHNILPGKYIVRLKPDVESHLQAHTEWVSEIHSHNLARRGGDSVGIEKTYHFASFEGYAGSFDDETLEAIKANPDVYSVEPDFFVPALATVEQENPPWGLSAISNADPPSSNSSYFYDSSAAEGTFIYIVDSGILLDHVDFEGRAEAGFASGEETARMHGTLVGSIAGGAKFGVAKKATVIDVQVMTDGGGSAANIIEGVGWAVNDVVSKGRVGKSVFNLSLGAPGNPGALNDACQAAIDAGITLVIAAGNANVDSAGYTPANTPSAITVAASNSGYSRWAYSNWGSTADIFAPGEQVTGAWPTTTTGEHTDSGTSLAAPHVAGVIAYLFALEGSRTPAEVLERLQELALKDLIGDTKEVPNILLYNGIGA